MAKRKKPLVIDSENSELLERIQERFRMAEAYERDQRVKMLKNMEFCKVDGQWESTIRHEREQQSKPCITVDRVTPMIALLVNDQRKNTPSIKVSPVSDGADEEVAKVLTGLVRHIEYSSNASLAYVSA